MGGTMEYERVRERNGLNCRPRDDVAHPYPNPTQMPDYDGRGILAGDLNRMERDALGTGPFGMRYPQAGADATGLPVETVVQVLRWFLCYPEPECDDCAAAAALAFRDPQSPEFTSGPYGALWRCAKHRGLS